ncbi:MAG: Pantothenate kinase [Campylobacterota bacterium]|nr:Pantothenate kinase [Campylobacterota bacterium]
MYKYKEKIFLADIGNSYFHIYDGKTVVHLSHEEAITKYYQENLYYICVKHALDAKINSIPTWHNVSFKMKLAGAYGTMGVDRKALCLSHQEGIFVDAGSAITVDVVEEGRYRGGFILPGLKAYLQAYKSISGILDIHLNNKVSLQELPLTTKDGISYGIIASVKALIDKHRQDKTLYITGGDGKLLSSFFEKAVFDEALVFKGMQNALGCN